MKIRELPKAPIVVIAVMFAVGLALYPSLGQRIPMHWNAMGTIDRWEPKSYWTVLQLPAVALGLFALFAVIPYFDPKRRNLRLSGRAYGLVLTAVTLLLALVYASMLATASGIDFPVNTAVVIGVSAMIAYLGSLMRTVKQNWTMGFRYSWTLADETVWAKTNDLGGRLFMAAGAIGLVGAFAPAPYDFVALLAPILLTVPITYIYAMLLYRRVHPEEMKNGVPRA